MKVLFDHQKFSLQRYGGISRYFADLNAQLNQIPGLSSSICALYSENEYVKNYPFLFNNIVGHRLFRNHRNRIIRWNKRYCKSRIIAGKFDVFHPTYYDPYFIGHLKKPFVVTVHDMIHELQPDLFPDGERVITQKQLLIENADAIIAISNYTKNDILKFFPQCADKITVVYHGFTANIMSPASLVLPDKYLLFVGERWHYKNFKTFAQAIAPALQTEVGLNLICAGGGKFSDAEQSHLRHLGIWEKCRQISGTEQELQQLYRNALLFVFPSLQEGFGLPLLEAFANNCPVACSNTTSLPEVAADAAQYFEPLNPDSITAAVSEVLNDGKLRRRLVRSGQQRLQQFTVKNCASNTLNVYRNVL